MANCKEQISFQALVEFVKIIAHRYDVWWVAHYLANCIGCDKHGSSARGYDLYVRKYSRADGGFRRFLINKFIKRLR